jgi:hypothetical protein
MSKTTTCSLLVLQFVCGCSALLTAPASHPHEAGPHGGTVAEWSDGRRHVEFTVDHAKQEATVYILDETARKGAAIRARTLLLTIEDPPFQLELVARPLEGERDETSSRFVGKHEQLGRHQEFAGTISGGAPKVHSARFKEEPASHSH